MTSYPDFLASKAITAGAVGIEAAEVNPMLFPFQRDIVRWALRRGRACIWADCGLGKTPMQLEWASQIPGDVLILAPLGVAFQTVEEGAKFGHAVTYCRSGADVQPGITITNYEMMEHFDLSRFTGIVLDESGCLKHHDSKFRNLIISSFARTPYRLACTATPAPNDYMELGNHAEFVGAMSRTEMLSMFFVHDGGDTSKWRLKGHAEEKFWRWLASWAVMLRKPSDLGYSDEGFVLPPIAVKEHVVAGKPSDGDLFAVEAQTLQERIGARRGSISDRVKACADIVNASGGQWVIWCHLNAEADALVKAIDGGVQVTGAEPTESKVAKARAFKDGTLRRMISKGSIFGYGMNWQHCHNVAFVGLSDSWEEYYQSVRRCWRFGQKERVNVHVIASETEGAVVKNIQRKERDADRLVREMVAHMSDINKENLTGTQRTQNDYEREFAQSEDGTAWQLYLGDCVDCVQQFKPNSIDFSIFSPPFASLYTYSASERDMGNSKSYDEFGIHFGFLVRELFRVMKPGRNVSFHCMNLPTTKSHHGYIGIQDFRGDLIRMFQAAGFIFHSEVCIWKDPVTAMQRTKALGLLWKQLKKDSCMSRQGIPDYLVTMRKPGENAEPVGHKPEEFPVAQWQEWASPVWMDINPSDTLQRESAREDRDERHICPLQLEVIRRAIHLWSNPGDLVLSPFAGIGSEGFVAIEHGRRFLGVELKRSYWEQAKGNLLAAQDKKRECVLL